jgi:hypothetical protein
MEQQRNGVMPVQASPDILGLVQKIIECVEARDEDAVDHYFGELVDHFSHDHHAATIQQYAERQRVAHDIAMGGGVNEQY